MVVEILRELKPKGLLIMSSPDKKFYSDLTGHINSSHLKEFYFHEFKGLLKKYFVNQYFLHQRIVYGSIINPENGKDGLMFYIGNAEKINKIASLPSAVYNIALCSNGSVP